MKSLIKSLALIVAGVVFLFASAMARASVLPVSGAAYWLDATDSSTLALDGANQVAQWNDKGSSGVNVSQASLPQQPVLVSGVLNGLPVVTFNQAQTQELNDGASGGSPIVGNIQTMFVVMSMPNPKPSSGEHDLFDSYLGEAGGNTAFRVLDTNSAGAEIFYGGGGGEVDNNNYTAGDFILMTSVWDGSGTPNASYVTIDDNGVSTTVTGTLTGAVLNPNDMFLGGSAGDFGSDLGEMLIYNSTLTGAQIEQDQDYLIGKWFTATAPEPASLSLLVVGGVTLLRRRRA